MGNPHCSLPSRSQINLRNVSERTTIFIKSSYAMFYNFR